MVTSFIIAALLIILGIIFTKSKIVSFLILVFMWIFYSLNTYAGDYEVYYVVYTDMDPRSFFSVFEPGFSLIMLISRKLQLPFLGFKMILGTIFIILLYCAVKRYTHHTACVLSIIMVFPFIYYTSVLRAGIAMTIISLAFKHILSEHRHGILKYVLIILFAMLFHYSSFFFLTFLLVKGKLTRKKVAFFGLMLVALFVSFYSELLLNIANKITTNSDILDWLSPSISDNRLNLTGKMAQIILVSLIIMATYFMFSMQVVELYSPLTYRVGASRSLYVIRKLFTADLLLLLFIPFFLITDVWMRIVWVVIPINVMVWSNTIQSLRTRRMRWTEIFVLAFCIILLIYSNNAYFGTKNSFEFMFKNNVIFNLLP